MKIQLGTSFNNRTKSFLAPCLKGHGESFTTDFNKLFKLGYGIDDKVFVNRRLLKNKRPIFILFDKGVNRRAFEYFLAYTKYQDYYITDYLAEDNLLYPRRHMIVLEVPKKYFKAYDKFLVGAYSEMYSKEEIDSLILKEEVIAILGKEDLAVEPYLSMVNEKFNTQLTREDVEEIEYDFPINVEIEQEIFNYATS